MPGRPRGGRVPSYHKAPDLPAGLARPSRYIRLGAEQGAGAALFAALGDMGRGLIDQHGREEEAAVAAHFARSKLAVDESLSKAALDHGEDAEVFRQYVTGLRAKWLEQVPENYRENAALYFDTEAQSHALKIMGAQRERETEESKAVLLKAMDAAQNRASAAMRGGEFDKARREAAASEDFRHRLLGSGMVTAEEFVAMGESKAYQLTRNKILGEGDRAKNGGLESYRAFIDGVKENDHLHPDDASRIVGELEADYRDMAGQAKAQQAEVDAQAKAERAAKIAALDLAVSRGRAGYKELEQARQGGLFDKDSDKFTSLSKVVDRRYEKDRKKAEGAALVNSALLGDTVLDPRDKEHRQAADDTYAAWADQEQIKALPVEARNSMSLNFVLKTGILPEQAASAIRAGMRGSPESQVAAADMIERLDAMPGDMLKGVGDEYVLAKGRLITAMTRAGLAPEEAVARAAELTDPNKRERTKARRDAFKDKDFDKITVNEVEDMFDPGWLPWQRDPDTPNAAEAQLLADANGLFEREYLLTGDKDLSKKYALKKIKNTWDVSRINGKRQLMKYPPESFYGIGGGDAWMRSDLVDAVTDMGMWDLTEPIEKRLVVESDLRTARGETIVAPDGSHRVAHTYPILIRNDDGAFEPVVDKNGKPKRWWPDASKVRAKRTRDLLEKAMIARKMTFLGGKDILRGGF